MDNSANALLPIGDSNALKSKQLLVRKVNLQATLNALSSNNWGYRFY